MCKQWNVALTWNRAGNQSKNTTIGACVRARWEEGISQESISQTASWNTIIEHKELKITAESCQDPVETCSASHRRTAGSFWWGRLLIIPQQLKTVTQHLLCLILLFHNTERFTGHRLPNQLQITVKTSLCSFHVLGNTEVSCFCFRPFHFLQI